MNDLYNILYSQLYYFQMPYGGRTVEMINFYEWVYWSPLKSTANPIHIFDYHHFIDTVKHYRQVNA